MRNRGTAVAISTSGRECGKRGGRPLAAVIGPRRRAMQCGEWAAATGNAATRSIQPSPNRKIQSFFQTVT
jgi:hypothetical protein